jgi:hypothetical protein
MVVKVELGAGLGGEDEMEVSDAGLDGGVVLDADGSGIAAGLVAAGGSDSRVAWAEVDGDGVGDGGFAEDQIPDEDGGAGDGQEQNQDDDVGGQALAGIG